MQLDQSTLLLMADSVPVMIWVTDKKGACTYLNKRWLEFTGQTLREGLGLGWTNALHIGDQAITAQQFLEASRTQQPFEIEYRLRKWDGTYEWVLDSCVPFRDAEGNFLGYIGSVTNINQRKLAEEAIRESENRFRTLVETLPQLVFVSDEKGRQIFVSSRWEEYTGIKPITADNSGSYVHPDDQPLMQQAWKHSLKTGLGFQAEARLRSKTGEYRWHHAQGEPVRNEKGEITRWMGSLTDIHDQKTASQKLEELVRQRTEELQRSNQDLQQFAHVASHDLKEPVRKIKTFIGRLQAEVGDHLNENAKLYISRIVNAVNRMVVMIDGVLSYSTISALEEMFEEVNLDEVIKNVELDLELIIHQKEATIRYSNLPTIEGAPVLLHQLFYNLVNNALKFTKPDVPPIITITSEIERLNGQDCASIIVQDNGIGFEQEYAGQIFSTFTRLNSKDKYEGSGLGLALCKNIVERHGGTINASGIPDVGASFEITLPLKK